jgi:hypothetical protein
VTAGDGRWLDELAVRATRGGFLRSLALAAGGLAFPLARPRHAAAAANDPTACRKGCFFAAHKNALRADDACTANLAQLGLGVGGFVGLWSNPFYGLAAEGTAMIRYASCTERVRLTQKAAQWDCMQPDCPGFDPAAAGGPCDGCQAAGGLCCPDQKVVTGYSCCTGTGGCCDPSGDGCASGVTACGG